MISVVMAAFNEAQTVGKVIELIQSLGIVDQIVVVDDLSSDETADVANRQKCDVIQNMRRLGQTRSLRRGMQRAKGDFIITMDADMDHKPSDIQPLLEHMATTNSDIVIGQRSSLPRLSEKIMSRLLRKFTGVTDTISGFRVITKRALDQQEFDDADTWGALFLLRCKRKGLVISESPIVTPPTRLTTRTGGPFTSNILICRAFLSCILCIFRIV